MVVLSRIGTESSVLTSEMFQFFKKKKKKKKKKNVKEISATYMVVPATTDIVVGMVTGESMVNATNKRLPASRECIHSHTKTVRWERNNNEFPVITFRTSH
jgi:hypothetical protein